MAREARLFLGPRDGETISIVEPKSEIEIMIAPSGRHVAQPNKGDDEVEYDIAIYTLDRNIKPGVFRYNYAGIKQRKGSHEDSQD